LRETKEIQDNFFHSVANGPKIVRVGNKTLIAYSFLVAQAGEEERWLLLLRCFAR